MTRAVLLGRFRGIVVAVAAAAALRCGTAARLGSREAGQRSQLRLSFSARPERIERCLERTDEELAKLPAHMRLRTECEGYSASYLLAVDVGDRRIVTDTLRGGGLRHDRPLHVFREHDLAPGVHRLRIEMGRLTEGANSAAIRAPDAEQPPRVDTLLGGRADRERDERARRAADAMPARLVLDTLISVTPMRVVLITFDNSTRRLLARTEP